MPIETVSYSFAFGIYFFLFIQSLIPQRQFEKTLWIIALLLSDFSYMKKIEVVQNRILPFN